VTAAITGSGPNKKKKKQDLYYFQVKKAEFTRDFSKGLK
jgi:hypothetical protein